MVSEISSLPCSNYPYNAFGLNIRSDVLIPGLKIGQPSLNPDISVLLGGAPAEAYRDIDPDPIDSNYASDANRQFWTAGQEKFFCLKFIDGPGFVIDETGSKIWVDSSVTVSTEELGLYLVGILGFTLRLRGIFCLHASSFVINNKVVAIIGSPGAGKSTTAAMFVRMGHQVVSDDILPLDFSASNVSVRAGYERLRLWPDASKLVFPSMDLPRLLVDWDKLYLNLTEDQQSNGEDTSLGAIYVLQERVEYENMRILDLAGAECIVELVSNTYRNELLTQALRTDEFKRAAELTDKVPVRVLHPPENIEALQEFCEMIKQDFIGREVPSDMENIVNSGR